MKCHTVEESWLKSLWTRHGCWCPTVWSEYFSAAQSHIFSCLNQTGHADGSICFWEFSSRWLKGLDAGCSENQRSSRAIGLIEKRFCCSLSDGPYSRYVSSFWGKNESAAVTVTVIKRWPQPPNELTLLVKWPVRRGWLNKGGKIKVGLGNAKSIHHI